MSLDFVKRDRRYTMLISQEKTSRYSLHFADETLEVRLWN